MKAPLYLIAAILSLALVQFSKGEGIGFIAFIFFGISCIGVIMSWIGGTR